MNVGNHISTVTLVNGVTVYYGGGTFPVTVGNWISTFTLANQVTAYAIISSSFQWGSSQAIAVRCVTSDGSAFESCAGGGSSGITYVSIISTFSASNPGYVYLANVATVTFNGVSQPVSQSGAWSTSIGNWVSTASVSQSGTFTVTPGTGAWNVTIGNQISTASISVSNWISTASVSVSNWVSTATVSVSNFITTQTLVNTVTTYSQITSTFQWTTGQAIATRCVNAAGTAFEACGGASSGDTYTHIISTFSINNPGFVDVNYSTINVAASGTKLTATGSSLNVNCTGGCGSAAQTNTFIAYSSGALTGGRIQFALSNEPGSTVVLKIMKIQLMAATEAAITGLNTNYILIPTTGTLNTSGSPCNVRLADTTGSALNAKVFCRGNNATVYSQKPSLGSITISSEETAIQANEKFIYKFDNVGETPLTLRAGEGIAIKQGALTAAAGSVGVQCVFTQE